MTSNTTRTATPSSGLMGNTNSQVGAAHKAMLAERLSHPQDPLARAVAAMAGISNLEDCCSLRSGESSDIASSGSEVGMLAIGSDGQSADIDIMVKTCAGLGATNQTSRFWASDFLLPSEQDAPAARALATMCGSLRASDAPSTRLTPGQLVSRDYAKSGQPLMVWLAQEDVLSRLASRAFAISPETPRGRKLLLLTLRCAGPRSEDIHLLCDRADLRDHIASRSSSTTSDGRRFVRIGPVDDAIELTPILRVKRKGGDSGERNSDQLQTAISPSEILKAVATKLIAGRVLREQPTAASRAIEALALNGRAAPAKQLVERHEPMGKLIISCSTPIECDEAATA